MGSGDAVWRPATGANESALDDLRAEAPVHLPVEYLEQLSISNGGEGDLGVEPGWIAFWTAEEVLSLNRGYSIPDNLPGFFGFGSNGGGDLLAFDAREGKPYPIVAVPFIPMDPDEAVEVASSFAELQALIGKLWDGAS